MTVEPVDPAGTPYPPYVRTAEDRARWDICLKTATAISELCEPSGVADSQFVWFTTRALLQVGHPDRRPIRCAGLRGAPGGCGLTSSGL